MSVSLRPMTEAEFEQWLPVDELALNAFGDNDPARSLYRSLGYREAAVIMNTRLDQA